MAAKSNSALDISWAAPDMTGKPVLTGYNLQYRVKTDAGDGAWTSRNHDGTTAAATLSSLTPETTHEVQVQATNAEGTSPWSDSGEGATSANTAPGAGALGVNLAENRDGSSTAVPLGSVSTTDADKDALTYTLSNGNSAKFAVSTAGALTYIGEGEDHETTKSYTLTVTATDPYTATGAITVTVTVTDQNEPPAAPAAPKVAAKSNSALDISWAAPDMTGKPVLTGYNLQYRVKTDAGDGAWTSQNHDGTTAAATLSSLTPETTHEVQVQATNAEGTSPWSDSGEGATSANTAPGAGALGVNLAENRDGSSTAVPLGSVSTTDADNDALTYTLSNGNSAKFAVSTAGALTYIGEGEDYETTTSYSLTVTATDVHGAMGAISVTVTITNVMELPGKPDAPAVSGATHTSVRVIWTAPSVPSGAPSISGYTLRYRLADSNDVDDWIEQAHTSTVASATISGLPPGVEHDVQVRATNDDGNGAWSDDGTGSPNDNTAPASTTESFDLAENHNGSVNAVNLGIATTSDADNDAITYTLSAVSNKFAVDSSSGALTYTGTGEDYEATTSHQIKLTVTATDVHGAMGAISVTVTITNVAELPGKPDAPAVSGATHTSVGVTWTAPSVPSGAPSISGYTLRYRLADSSDVDDWIEQAHTSTVASATISGLPPGVEHDVQVRATNDDGNGAWSDDGTGSPNDNTAPGAGALGVNLAENRDGSSTAVPLGSVSTTDADKDALIYTLTVGDSAKFAVSTAGALTYIGEGEDHETTKSYTLTVTATDPYTATGAITVTVTVTDQNEPPAAPAAPKVAAKSNSALDISWAAPDMTGKPVLTGYNLQYRVKTDAGDGAWTSQNHDGTTAAATLSSLTPETTHEVQVQATNAEGTSPWSDSGEGATSANTAPGAGTLGVNLAENRDGSSTAVPLGSVSTTDADNDALTYTLTVGDSAKFAVSTAGALTYIGEGEDHETTKSYTLTVTATDPYTATGAITVTVTVTDQNEPPAAPAAPKVAAKSNSALDISWAAPDMTGKPVLTGYNLQYRVKTDAGDGAWTSRNHDGTTAAATLSSLTPETTHEVQVQATNAEGTSPWSDSGEGATSANTAPGAGALGVNLAENRDGSSTAVPLGSVSTTDADNDALTYTLTVGDSAKFAVSTAGALTYIGEGEDHETTKSYTLTVTATDPYTATGAITVTVTVTDQNEPPAAPAAPKVAAKSNSALDISWAAPDMTGKPVLTGYNLQYRVKTDAGDGAWTSQNHDGTTAAATLSSLTPETTHEVQVQATNAEGTSPWSDSGEGATSANTAPGAGTLGVNLAENRDGSSTAVPLGSVSTTDADKDALIYTLTVGDSAKFAVSTAGALTYIGEGEDHETTKSYTLTVTATDPYTATGAITVTVTVTDQNEPPAAPAAPKVAAKSNSALDISWAAPDMTGKPVLTGYNLQYRVKTDAGDGAWTSQNHDGTTAAATLSSLTPETTHEVQVQATNAEGTSPWSDSGEGATSANTAPGAGALGVNLAENRDGSSTAVPLGSVSTTDADNDALTYTLTVGDSAKFAVSTAGALTYIGEGEDHETTKSYTLTVTATDPYTATGAITVTVTVTDQNEPPAAPAAPKVAAKSNSALDISWAAPDMTGKPVLTGYNLQYRVKTDAGDGAWTSQNHDGTTAAATLSSLTPETTHEVQVQATNAEGTSPWSDSGEGATSANTAPGAGALGVNLAENRDGSSTAVPLGSVSTTDADNDALTYTLTVGDSAKFAVSTAGALTYIGEGEDHETTKSYTLTVTATDPYTATGAITVTVTVTDQNEPPAAPAAPKVAAKSNSALDISWAAPDMTGKPVLTGYNLQYRVKTDAGDGAWTSQNHDGTTAAATLSSLTPETTHEVQVQATNAEGTSPWSDSGEGATSANTAPGAGALGVNLAENRDGSSTAVPLGSVSTTDADNDALTYTLTVGDSAKFAVSTAGALTYIGEGEDHETTKSYTLTVTATDPYTATGAITVTVTVTDQNEPPAAPAAPKVAAKSNSALDISWAAPDMTGKPVLTGYNLQYRVKTDAGDGAWTSQNHDGTTAAATLSSLTPETTHEVQVQATNAEGTSPWSDSGEGATSANTAPGAGTLGVNLAENRDGSSTAVPLGSVSTTDADNDALTYTLTVGDSAKFAVSTAGALTYIGEGEDHETTKSYTLTVTATDPYTATGAITVTVTVTDQNEPPAAPAAPKVAAKSNSALDISWAAPDMTGKPVLTGYNLQYRVKTDAGDGAWTSQNHDGTTAAATLSSLTPETTHEVQVQATNAEGTSPWSDSGEGATSANTAPGAGTLGVNLAENRDGSSTAVPLGSVSTTDADNDALTYTLTVGDSAKFAVSTAGALTYIGEGEDHETTKSYTLTVTATDPYTATGAITVTVTVTDQNEPPAAPAAPKVAAKSNSALDISWAAPDMTGKPVLTGYNLQYRVKTDAGDGAWTSQNHDGTTAAATLSSLTPETTHEVQVQATNAEGTSPWSDSGEGATSANTAPGAGTLGVNLAENRDGSSTAVPLGSVSTTDADNDALTYTLTVGDSAKFAVSTAGALTYIGEGEDHETTKSYTLTVTATDPYTATGAITVTVTVTDQNEPPAAPAAPKVAAKSNSALDISWAAPDMTGKPVLTGYNLQYRVKTDAGDGAWTSRNHDGTTAAATLSSLTPETTHEVQVQATNAEGTSPWSDSGEGATSANTAPGAGALGVNLAENRDGSSTAVPLGSVSTTDADNDALTYTLTVGDSAKFAVSTAGALTYIGEGEDHETTKSYTLTVTATDPYTATGAITVTVTVTDQNEPPAAPAAPKVAAKSNSALDISWAAPDMTGKPVLTDYNLRYRLKSTAPSGSWTSQDHTGTGTSAVISSLTPETDYQVQVQAVNAEGDSGWSNSGEGAPSANTAPGAGTLGVNLAENRDGSSTAVPLGAVSTTDADADALTYTLSNGNSAKFAVSTAGALTYIGEGEDHESTTSYSLTVTATDPHGATGAITVTVTVTDQNEPPAAPAAPTVDAKSNSALDISWAAPDMTGKPGLTDYNLRYRLKSTAPSGSWTSQDHTGTGTSAVISSLTPETDYQVQVQATNAEGTSPWSDSGEGAPSANTAPGAGTLGVNLAENRDGSSTAVPLGSVSTTDADKDALIYTLTVGDSAKFAVSTAGALTYIGEGEDHETTKSYTLTVTATDPYTATGAITVTVTVTDQNEPPAAPAAPKVAAKSNSALDISWAAPDMTGKPVLTGYNLQYRVKTDAGDGAWTSRNHDGTTAAATLSSLTPETTHEVQVQATNAEGTSPWSDSGEGATSANTAPGAGALGVNLAENRDGSSTAVPLGSVSTTDADKDALIYTLTVGDSAKFAVSTAGALTYIGEGEDHETTKSYTLTVTATDPYTATGAITVTVTVTDQNEPPAAPAAPKVAAKSNSALDISWAAPDMTGKPVLTGYNLQYRVKTDAGDGAWTSRNHDGTTAAATLSSLTPETTHEVQVQATNAEGTSPWSDSGEGATSANTAPGAGALGVNLAENRDGSSTAVPLGSVSTTDADKDALTYTLSNGNSAKFAVSTAGALTYIGEGEDHETTKSYTLTVTATDPYTATGAITVTVTVTDQNEPPAAPAAPKVAAKSNSALDISWAAPDMTGKPVLTGYNLQYRVKTDAGDGAWTSRNHDGTTAAATLSSLTPETTHEVQVQATNAEGTSPWSDSGEGATSANTAPGAGALGVNLAENRDGSSTAVPLGSVSTTDADNDALTYTLSNGNSAKFAVSTAGALTYIGEGEDYETTTSYSLTVTATDVHGAMGAISVTVTITNVMELPGKPDAPAVSGATHTSVRVIWTAPSVPSGAPSISGYTLRYRLADSNDVDDWIEQAHTSTVASATISGLPPGVEHDVQVRATNDDGNGAWSDDGTGSPNDNTAPASTTESFDLAENHNGSVNAVNLGIATTSDADNDAITYTLSAVSNKFAVDSSSGALTYTGTGEDYEATTSHQIKLTVTATDVHGAMGAISVTVTITNVAELPGKPDAPAVSGATHTSVGVTWTAPSVPSGAPSISGYTLRYRLADSSDVDDWIEQAHTSTVASATISGLPPGVEHDVQVRATNDDGNGAWSDDGTGSPNDNTAPGAGALGVNLAENRDGSSTAVPLGSVSTTDADKDALIYTLTVGDSAKFAVSTAGALTYIGEGEDHETTKSYTLTVTATDPYTATGAITVTVTVTDQNEPPAAPAAPKVAAKSNSALDISWAAPDMTGKPVLTGYNLQYRVKTDAGDGAWTSQNHDGTTAAATLSSLTPETTHEVQVQATNAEGTSPWSDSGEGATSANTAPGAGALGVNLAENRDGSSTAVPLGSVSTTDADNDALTYTLTVGDSAKFAVSTAGALTYIGEGEDHETTKSYTLTVTATDPYTATGAITVTVTVTDQNEPPAAPAAPKVAAKSNSALDISWAAPDMTGKPVLTGYNLQYRVKTDAGDGAWTSQNHDGTTAAATLSSLTPETTHEVQVQATNAEGTSPWSDSGEGATSANTAPGAGALGVNLAENRDGSSTAVPLGSVSTTDADKDALTYTLSNGNSAKFAVSTAGALTYIGEGEDHETTKSYTLTVTATDPYTATGAITVTVTVTDQNEPPAAPAAPKVAAKSNSALDISWAAPDMTGKPVLTGYNLQYRVKTDAGDGAWTSRNHDGTTAAATLSSLTPETTHEVQVQATNAEGTSPWSDSGEGATSANTAPGAGTLGVNLAENRDGSSTAVPLGSVSTTDADNDALTYTLTVGDSAKFAVSTAGALTYIGEGEDHETTKSYTLTVTATDPYTATGAITVTVTVTDQNEPPAAPAAPKVAAKSNSALDISWAAPDMTGKPVLTGYNLQYRVKTDAGDGAWTSRNHDGTTAAATLSSLTPETTHEVQVQATNAEGTSPWSDSGEGATSANTAPGAGALGVNLAENRDGSSTAVPLGSVSTTDADNDALTYTLTVGDSAKFAVSTAGALTYIGEGEDHETTKSYTLTVTATDPYTATGAITVTVTVTDQNEPPAAPAAPKVAAKSNSALDISWAAPDMTGKPVLTGYNLQYRVKTDAGDGAWTSRNHDGTTAAATLSSLTPETTHEVQVQATNAEGTSPWSDSGEGATSANTAPGAGALGVNLAENRDGSSTAVPLGSVSTTDADNDALIYTLTVGDSAKFAVSTAGALTYIGEGEDHETTKSYTLTVTATDPYTATGAITVTVTVTDQNEPPAAPAAPKVAAKSNSALDISWAAPDMTGKPVLTGYNLQYRVKTDAGDGAWTSRNHDGTTAAATLSSLTPETTHEVQVQATNAEGTSPWSDSGEGATSANTAPGAGALGVNLAENRDGSSTAVPLGSVSTTDADHDALTYTLSNGNSAKFAVSTAGALTYIGEGEDHETTKSYTLTVTATDPYTATGAITVTVTVTDQNEPPAAPAAPKVAAKSNSALDISWAAPDMTGKPVLTGYNLQYRVKTDAGDGAWTSQNHDGTTAAATLSSLTPETTHEVQVQATNAEGTSPWSDSGEGATSANTAPGAGALGVNLAENRDGSSTAVPLGSVSTTDADNDALTYTLSNGNSAKFAVSTAGALTYIGEGEDYETTTSYSLTVTATDVHGAMGAISVTVTITNVMELPGKPDAPAVSGATHTSVRVIWTAPSVPSGAPSISGYTLRYRLADSNDVDDWIEQAHTSTVASATISGLPPGVEHDVQVRATNDDGNGAWSDDGTGSPNDNTAPASTTESFDLAENHNGSVNAVNLGIATTSDADNDAITYTLSAVSNKFAVDSSSGALTYTGTGEDYEATTSHQIKLTVTATDVHGAMGAISVTVTITNVAELPGKPDAPAVSGATHTSVGVTWTAPSVPSGAPSISGYTLRYRLADSSDVDDWIEQAHTSTVASATISGLPPGVEHDVQVRATNDDGNGAWSDDGTGSPNDNTAPGAGALGVNLAENRDGSSTAVPLGSVSTTDADKDALIYTLTVGDSAKFAVSTAGALTYIGEGEDHETTKSYTLTVTATDPYTATGAITVTVTVTDQNEPPAAPAAPKVAAKSNSALDISWAAPDMTGKPVLTGYNLQYRVKTDAGDGAWTSQNHDGTTAAATLSSLTPETTHEVQVQATNAEGTSPWSDSGEGATSANTAPGAGTLGVNLAENRDGSSTAVPLGSVSTTDADNDALTYTLTVGDSAKFAVSTAGALTYIGEGEDHETTKSYTLTVTATDPYTATGAITVTVTVTDQNEPPAAPAAPKVAAKSNSALDISWAAPDMTGKPVLTDYNLRYRLKSTAPSGSWTGTTREPEPAPSSSRRPTTRCRCRP